MSYFSSSTKTVELPETKVSVTLKKIAFRDALALADMKDLPTAEQAGRLLSLAPDLIQSWTAKDENGDAIPVSEESVGDLPADDGNVLIDAISTFSLTKHLPADEGK